jgi:hypothetical protein
MRRAIYWVGASFTIATMTVLVIIEGLTFIGVGAWLLLQGAFFWLLIWMMFGSVVMAGIFAVGKLAAYGVGGAIMAVSGYEPEE